MPNQPKTPKKGVRIDDAIWIPSRAKAKRTGTSVSAKVREGLVNWLAEDEASLPTDPRERLRILAEAQGIDVAAIVREAVAEYLRRE